MTGGASELHTYLKVKVHNDRGYGLSAEDTFTSCPPCPFLRVVLMELSVLLGSDNRHCKRRGRHVKSADGGGGGMVHSKSG